MGECRERGEQARANLARVAIVIVNWNTRERLRACLESVRQCATSGGVAVAAVVDNDSADGSCAMVEECFPEVVLLRNAENVGFARAVNAGARVSDSPYVLLLNSDARLTSDAFESLLELAESNPQAAVVGAALVDLAGRRRGAAAGFPSITSHFLTVFGIGKRLWGSWYPSIDPYRTTVPCRVDWVGGACMLIRRDAFDEVGGMDEGYFLYAEEMDLCYRLGRRGWQVWHQPVATVVHEGGGSGAPSGYRSAEILYASQMRFFESHYGAAAAWLLKMETYGAIVAQQWGRALLRVATLGRYTRPGLSIRRIAMLRRGLAAF